MIFMAIQLPDVGTGVPADKTGDSPWLAMKKVRENFNDPTNAASKLIGAKGDSVPRANQVAAAFLQHIDSNAAGITDCDLLPVGTFVRMPIAALNNPSAASDMLIETRALFSSDSVSKIQTAYAYSGLDTYVRHFWVGTWTEWTSLAKSRAIYNKTTASGANVVVDATGNLMRSTSSERYKDILSPLELDDARYADAMALKPIVYRSTAGADNPAYHYYSFSAEELGAYDPAFTLWRDTETVTDEDGSVSEQPLEERQAEGININALLAMGHAIAIKQGELIKRLEARIEAIETK